MEDLAADFIIENNEPLEFDAEISEPEHFDCSFELYAAGTTWGSISGTLSNQTDLQAALDLKADKSEVESVTGALADSITALDSVVSSNYTTLDDKIDSVSDALSDSITALDSIVSSKADVSYVDSITGALSDSISGIDSIISNYGDIVSYNAANFATSIQGALADTAVQPTDLANVAFSGEYSDLINTPTIPTVNDGQLKIQVNGSDLATFSANQGTDTIANISIPNAAEWGNITGTLSNQTDLQNALDAKVTNNATGTKALAIGDTSQSTAEGGVAIGYGARSNSTYATAVGEEARANNTNTTVIGKAAKATEARAIAIGSGAEANAQDAIAIKGINNTANTFQVYTFNMLDMSTGLIPDARISTNIARTVDIPTVNNSSIDFQINGTSFDTITLNQSSNDTINISVPTDTNDLTNGAGYITAASLPTDYYTKSEIDAIIPQPTKVPIVYYQPTDSYCYTESNNRFYGSYVFEKLYLVQPKTSGTTQVIDMSTTFSLSFTIDYQKAPSASITLAEIMTSYSAGKGVLLQLNSTGLYYKNNITGTTITGTRALIAGNSYDIKAEYDGTHMIISYKLSSDANYTQINSTTCTCDGSNYNYAAIGMNADNGNMSLSSVVLTNGADTLYSYTAGKIALDYDGSTLKLNAYNQLSVDFTGYATENWVTSQGFLTGITSGDVTSALGYTPYNSSNPDGFITSAALANYLQKDVAQSTTGTLTFVGQKKILFKQSSSSDKLGFTLYNSSNTELGALEYRPNTISGAALLNLNCPYAADYVGFRYWGTAVNIIAPKVSTAGDYYIPTHITNGNTTVTANNAGTVNINSLLPDISGKQNALTAGSNITISGDTISATDTTYSDFTGADSITAGSSGLVPAPSAGDDDKILTGGGTWESTNAVIGYTPADISLSNLDSTGQNIADTVKDQNTSSRLKYWAGTQAQYDAIVTKDSNTIYNVEDTTSPIISILDGLYPVGAIYIGTMSVCPLQTLGVGTWQLVATDRVLQGAGTRGSVGTTINESLPNITGGFGQSRLSLASAGASGAFTKGVYGTFNYANDASTSNSDSVWYTFSAANSSSTYQNGAPVQQNGYLVNIWERIA